MKGLADAIDRLNLRVGQGARLLVIPTVLVAFVVVYMRYVVGTGQVWMQELYVWMHSTIFMVAAGYCLLREDHVRVDVFRRRFSRNAAALVDLLGSLLLLGPTVVVVALVSHRAIERSWGVLEASPEAGGLPFVYLHKSVILLFCLLTGLQGISLAIRSYRRLKGRDESPPGIDPVAGA